MTAHDVLGQLERTARHALLVCLAIFALLFMATESNLAHHHAGSSDAACPVCHIAHHAPIQVGYVVKAAGFGFGGSWGAAAKFARRNLSSCL